MILGYAIEKQRTDGSFYVVRTIWIGRGVSRTETKKQAQALAKDLLGIVTPVGVLSEPEMQLEIAENERVDS